MKRLVKEGTTTRRLVKGSKQEMWKVECDATIDFTGFSEDEIYELVVSVHMDSIAEGKATLYSVNPNEKTLLEVDGTRFRMNPLLY